MAIHKNLTGDTAIHEIMYVQSSDPGAVGANKFWLDTTDGDALETGAVLKQRNGANSGWTTRADVTIKASWVTLADGATVTIDATASWEPKCEVTLGGDRTLAITGAANGQGGILRVTQDGTGGRTLTLPSGSLQVGGGGTAAGLSTDADAVDLLGWEYDGTNYWWTVGKAAG